MRLLPALLAASLLAWPAAAADKPKFGSFGVDLTSMDKSVKPGENFFLYVNGKWLKTAVIPPDRSQTGSFQDLQILSEQRMRAIVDELEKKPYDQLSDEEKKLRDLYDAFEDTAAIEANGLRPVQKDLDYIAGLQTPTDVARAMASVPLATSSVYDIGIGVDDKNPDNYSLNLNQSGLGLPDRDYYSEGRQGAGRHPRRLSPVSRRHDVAGGDERHRKRAPTASWRWKPRSQKCSGAAPTAATRTRSIIR